MDLFLHKIITLPVVTRGYERCIFAEQDKLQVFRNIEPRKIFGCKEPEIRKQFRKLGDEDIRLLYKSASVVSEVK